MTDAQLRATFDARWNELGLAQTELALAHDATITPVTLARTPGPPAASSPESEPATPGPRAWTRPDPSDLPRISLATSSDVAPGIATPPATSRPDLELHGLIGEGGMGRVHAARQRSLERDVAVKTVKSLPASEMALTALLREAVITGTLEHPGIVPVHALGIDGHGAPVLVMKRVEGVEWRTLMREPDHPAWVTRPGSRLKTHLEILMQICQAVHFAHSRGIVHCDIKPENVMLGDFGETYLVDWGIAVRSNDPAALEGRSGLVGTPAYMAPELVAGRPVGPFTDVYLLGATLHEILTGRFRHSAKSLQEALMSAFCSEPVAYAAEVPAELGALCNRATHREPTERVESALAFRQALADYLQHRGSNALADQATERLGALHALLGPSHEQRLPDLGSAYRLASEARFGFTQALREWADNAAAKAGLDACVAAQVELELRQGHAQSAAVLLAELGAPPAELTERVAAAKRKERRARAEDEQLRAMARDLDTRVAGRERARGIAALSGASLAIAAFALSQPNPTRIHPRGLLTFALLMLVMMVIGVALWRKQVLQNAFNRKLVGVMLLSGATLVASRLLATAMNMPATWVFVQDLMLLAALAAATSVLLLRWLWPLAFMLLGAAWLCLESPSSSPMTFAAACLLAGPLVAFALWKHRHDADLSRITDGPDSTPFSGRDRRA